MNKQLNYEKVIYTKKPAESGDVLATEIVKAVQDKISADLEKQAKVNENKIAE